MSQYSVGTVDTTSGSQTVTGTDTQWTFYASAGDMFQVGNDPNLYDIAEVVSDTEITLVQNYPSTFATQGYVIISDFTANHSLPLPNQGDLRFADINARQMKIIDAALSAGLVYLGPALDKDLNAAPTSGLSDGDSYIVAASVASGDDWFGYEDYYVTWDAGTSTWLFTLPVGGNSVFVEDENKLYFYTGTSWMEWLPFSVVAVYRRTFTDANLTTGVLTVTHSLGQQYPLMPMVFDNNDLPWVPDWDPVDANTMTIDLSPHGTIAGTWRLTVLA